MKKEFLKMRDKLKIGFVGTSDWGDFYLQLLNSNSNIFIDNILALNYQNNRVINNNNKLNYMFFANKSDYKRFSEDLDTIIVAGWPDKIPKEVIEYYSFPILNIHASLLPKYRGPEPIIQQILNNEKRGGVTIHRINSNWDDGEICNQFEFSIDETDDNRTLFLKACRTGKKCLEEVIKNFLSNSISFIPQENGGATYYPRLDIAQYIIDSTKSIKDIQKYLRAFIGAYPLLVFHHDKLIALKRFYFSKENLNKENKIVLNDGYLYFYEAELFDK